MMFRTVAAALLAAFGSLVSNGVSADPLTFYTDEASWLAAVSGHPVGPYTSDVTETWVFSTLGGTHYPACAPRLCVAATSYLTREVSFSSYEENLSAGPAYDEACGSDPTADCAATAITGTIFQFNSPIFAFGAWADSNQDGGSISLNGQVLPIYEPTFFGVVGPFSSLDFEGRANYDDTLILSLDNIVVAVPEPASIALFASLMVMVLGAAWSRLPKYHSA